MWSPGPILTPVSFLRFIKYSSGYVDPMWLLNFRNSKLIVLSVRLGAVVLEISKDLRLIRPANRSLGSSLIPMFPISRLCSVINGRNQDSSIMQEGFSMIFKCNIYGEFGPRVWGIDFNKLYFKHKSDKAAQGRNALSSMWVILLRFRSIRITELSPVKLFTSISDILLPSRSKSVMSVRSPAGTTLQWRHNEHDSVSNHQPHDCLLNLLFGRRSKNTSKLHVTGLCAGNSPGTGEFPAQRASNAENVSIWWRRHGVSLWYCKFSPWQGWVHIRHTPANNRQRTPCRQRSSREGLNTAVISCFMIAHLSALILVLAINNLWNGYSNSGCSCRKWEILTQNIIGENLTPPIKTMCNISVL